MKRREAVQLLAVAPLATAFRWAPESVSHAAALVRGALDRGAPYEPKFFTAHEWDTVRVLVDLIIPKDERSGSATEDRKSTRLNSSHVRISYAVFCLKKKKKAKSE